MSGGALYLPGHVAVATLLSGSALRARWGRAGAWAVAGALAPDVLDKSLRALGVFPWGRTIGHSVLVIALVGLVAALGASRGRQGWRSMAWFAAGAATHIGADLVADLEVGVMASGYAFSTWFLWPWSNPDRNAWRVPCVLHAGRWFTVVESVAVLLAWRMMRLRRKEAGGDAAPEIG